MSNLIIGIEETNTDNTLPLVGRVLMINTAKAHRFQCFGFFVSRNHPIETVPKDVQELPIRQALKEGKLLDITDNEELANKKMSGVMGAIDEAIDQGNLDRPTQGEEVSKILMGKDAKGNSYVIIPKDEEDYKRMQVELETTGHIRMPKPKTSNYTGLSPIIIEDLPAPKQEN
jgi:hypothetical protein